MKNVIKGLSATKRAEIKDIIEVSAEAVYLLGFADGQAASPTVEDKPTVEQPNYQTEKRIAKIGESILMTNSHSTYGEYKNGDVLEVVEVRSSGLSAKGIEVGILHSEYEVIVANEVVEPIPAPAPLTANQQRAQSIQKAKEFKDALIDDVHGYYLITSKSGEKFLCDAIFKHNQTKRTTTCILVGAGTGYTRKKAVIHCQPNEVFNEPIGEVISLYKALQIDIPQEFLDAVQPDEKVVGMMVDVGKDGVRRLVSDDNLVVPNTASHIDSYYGETGIIIDDTNAEYVVG